jgi:ATP-dependent Clp protease ATP-binding subunit ClpA
MGARPMARLIQEQVKKPMANELLLGSLASGGHVKVTARDSASV